MSRQPEVTTNELVRQSLIPVEANFYQEGEQGFVVVTPGLEGVARFTKSNGKILFDGISQLSKVTHLREWKARSEKQ